MAKKITFEYTVFSRARHAAGARLSHAGQGEANGVEEGWVDDTPPPPIPRSGSAYHRGECLWRTARVSPRVVRHILAKSRRFVLSATSSR
jgi:hypothetical protein